MQVIKRIPVKAQVGMKKELKFSCNKPGPDFAGPPSFMVCFLSEGIKELKTPF
jgi:hypothetical protein